MKLFRFNVRRNLCFLCLNIICFIVLLILITVFWDLRSEYQDYFDNKVIKQMYAGVSYKIIEKQGEGAILHVGDLLGTNPVSAGLLERDDQFIDYKGRQIVIIRMQESKAERVTIENFYNVISNKDGIVLADNFCTSNWNSVREKALYQSASLSPGFFCFSEPQTRLIDQLIKRFNVSRAIIYYDVQQYTKFIDTFLRYLDENNVDYTLLPAQVKL